MGKKLWLAVMLVAVSSSAMAKWAQVEKSNSSGGYTNYVETALAQRTGNTVKLWTMTDYRTTRFNSYLSLRVQREYDCTRSMERALQLTAHSMNMLGGNIVSTMTEPTSWSPVTPSGLGRASFNFACTGALPKSAKSTYGNDAEVEKYLLAERASLQKQLPMVLSKMTVTNITVLPGRRMMYLMTIHPGVKVTAEGMALQKQESINQFCTNPYPTFRDFDVTIEHHYMDAQANFIFSTSTSNKDCAPRR